MPFFALWLKQSAHNGEQFLIECFPTKQKNKMEVSEKKKKVVSIDPAFFPGHILSCCLKWEIEDPSACSRSSEVACSI